MNPTRSSLTLVCFSLLALSAVSTARAEFKCDQRQLARVDAKACAKAAEGPAALRQYIWRTQAIYNLQMSDYARFEGDEEKVQRVGPVAVVRPQSPAGVARSAP